MLAARLPGFLRKALPGRFHTTVGLPALLDFLDVVNGLSASHIAVFHYRVIVVFWLCKLQYVFSYNIPLVGISAIALTKSHGVTHVMDAAIVGCQNEKRALTAVAYVAETMLQFS